MPYISANDRRFLQPLVDLIEAEPLRSPGELNYLLTKLVHHYASCCSGYQGWNDVIGALECAKLEVYRRKIAAYEDRKIEENGDI